MQNALFIDHKRLVGSLYGLKKTRNTCKNFELNLWHLRFNRDQRNQHVEN